MRASCCSALIACRRLAASTVATTLVVAWVVIADQRGAGTTGPAPASQGRGAGPALPAPPVPKPLVANAAPVRSCESLRALTLRRHDDRVGGRGPGTAQVPASCRVTAIVAHPSTRDRIRVWIALPEKDWNGRFQGVGGGGFSGGNPNGVVQPLRAGYAAGSTDTGHEGGSGSFALDANGRLDLGSDSRQCLRRHSRDDRRRQGPHCGVLRHRATTRLLQRVLHRRAAGPERGAAISGGLRRHSGRRAGDQLDQTARRATLGHRS